MTAAWSLVDVRDVLISEKIMLKNVYLRKLEYAITVTIYTGSLSFYLPAPGV